MIESGTVGIMCLSMNDLELRKYIEEKLIHSIKKTCLNSTAVQHGYLKKIENELNSRINLDIDLQEKLYLFYYNIEKPICSCGKSLSFIKFSKGYYGSCRSCSQKKLRPKGSKCHFSSKKSIKEIFNEKYGVDNPSQLDSVKEKRKKTFIQKYEVDNPWKSDKIINKIKNTRFKNLFDRFINSQMIMSRVEPLFSIEDFKGNNSVYKWRCRLCDNIFEDSLKDGRIPRCQKCFPLYGSISNLEKEISSWLKSLNIETIENTKSIISPLELDIYIPSHDLAIEFNGLYWHSESQGKNKDYHIDKTNRCHEKGIQLLHIWENEWIEKQDIVKSIIKSKLGLYDSIIHGRKCSVKYVSNKEASKFYFENHIQSFYFSSVNIGLYHNKELVSCLSFSKSRFNKKYDWEITRFANKLGYKIHGGFGKLWKHRPEGSIITYSDKRLFSGSVYKKYMRQLSDSGPSYLYIKNGQIHNRMEFQKYKLIKILSIFDSSLTEWENMQLNGYDRIWDCGNHVFVLENN